MVVKVTKNLVLDRYVVKACLETALVSHSTLNPKRLEKVETDKRCDFV